MSTLYLWADGSGTTGAPTGAGLAVTTSLHVKVPTEILDGKGTPLGVGTNNTAELFAIREALTWMRDRLCNKIVTVRGVPYSDVVLLSDSEYALNMMTLPWKAQVNQGLIAELRAVYRDVYSRSSLLTQHVRGHVGHVGNELADLLAGRARETQRAETYEEALAKLGEGLYTTIRLTSPPAKPRAVSSPGTAEAFDQGKKAALVGLARTVCPYKDSPDSAKPRSAAYVAKWTQWLLGWDSVAPSKG